LPIVCSNNTHIKQTSGLNKKQWDADEKESSSKEIKLKKSCGSLPKENRKVFSSGIRTAANQTIVCLPEEVLNELTKLNPRDFVNIIVN